MSPVRTLLAALTLGATLSGCPASKVYREGVVYQESGSEYEAANRYLKALDINENHRKAREALLAVAPDAYEEKLGFATGYESREDYATALTEYTELDAFLGKLKHAGALNFEVIDVRAKAAEMQNSAAEERYRAAELLFGAQQYETAIDTYRGAQSFKKAYKDTDVKIATSYVRIAEREQDAKNYRKAAEAFGHAVASGGRDLENAASRASTIYRALGEHFLEVRACRKATRDLRQAKSYGADVDGELDAALECAVTPIAVMPFENPTGVNPAGLALGDTVADQVLTNVRQGASEFVRIVDRSALDTILSEQGLTGASPKGLRGVRYLVTGRLTQVLVEEGPPTATARTTTGRQEYACTKTTPKGASYQTTCSQEVPVSFTEVTARSNVRLVASAKVIDVTTGEQVSAPQVEAAAEDGVDYAEGFKTANGVLFTPWPQDRSSKIQITNEPIAALAGAQRERKSMSELVRAASTKLGADLAKAVISGVDHEDTASDPADLALSE